MGTDSTASTSRLTVTDRRERPGQWCWCPDIPEDQDPHDCAEDHATRPQCQLDGGHVHPVVLDAAGYHPCDKPDCFRKVSQASRYCCIPCSTAAEAAAPYEIEPYSPDMHRMLCHSKECEQRRSERGEYSASEADALQGR